MSVNDRLDAPARRSGVTSRRGGTMIWLTTILIASFIGWASVAEIDQVARAPAQVIASGRTHVVQATDAGVLQRLHVREGDRVRRGQMLAQFDRAKLQAAHAEALGKRAASAATIARVQAELSGGEPRFGPEVDDHPAFRANQLALMRQRRAALDDELKALRGQWELARDELAQTEPLLKTGDIGRAEVLRLRRQVVDLEGQMAARRNRYLQELQAELAKSQEELNVHAQAVIQRREQLEQSELTTPINGIVKNIRVTSVGSFLRAGEELMQIVPLDDDLVVEAKVRPADIAFLKIGQPADLKIDSFDYTVYGTFEGELIFISPDSLVEEQKPGEGSHYRVRIRVLDRRLSTPGARSLELQPGMTAQAEIRTGRNTVLRYLLKPVIKTVGESFGER